MSQRRRYDDKFRASAVVTLEAAGYPDKEGALAQVSKHLGVPHNTLRGWYHAEHNPPPSQLRQEKKEELHIELRKVAYQLIAAMPGKIIDANLQQVATSLGIAIDKMQLLEGGPTEIVETRESPLDKLRSRLDGIATNERERIDSQHANGSGS